MYPDLVQVVCVHMLLHLDGGVEVLVAVPTLGQVCQVDVGVPVTKYLQ